MGTSLMTRICALTVVALASSFAAAAEATPQRDAPPTVEPYFAIGPWRIGMPRDEALTHFVAAEPREERVLRMRFGIGMNTDHTLEEVGQQFSVTRERIRQIEAKALRKLKHPSRSRKLRSFLDN